MVRNCIIILLCLFTVQMVNAQVYTTRKTTNKKAQKYYKAGLEAFRAENFMEARKQFERCLSYDSIFIDPKIRLAQMNHDQGFIEKAREEYIELLDLAPDYKFSLYFEMGLIEWRLDHFDDAIKHFNIYLENGDPDERTTQTLKSHIQNCRFAAEAIKHPVPYIPMRLSDSINTPEDEFLPFVFPDGKTIIYGVKRNGQEDFYIAYKTEDNIWGKGKPLAALNSEFNEASQSMTADGNYFVFTACNRPDGMGRCDIYFSEKEGKYWSMPRNLGPPVNSSGWESQPSLAANGQELYFSSDRKGGYGGLDIWKSSRNSNGFWSEPQNLGPTINSSGNEESPFIHPDNNTLYFKSNGRPGMGGDDIFYSKRKGDEWREAINIGYPINTKANEGSMFVALDGKTAYYSASSSLFQEATDDNIDIFSFSLHENAQAHPVTYAKAIIKDKKSKWPLSAHIIFYALNDGEIFYEGNTDNSGSFLVCLPMDRDYGLHVSRPEYIFQSVNFALTDTFYNHKPFEIEILLEKIPDLNTQNPNAQTSSSPVILQNVFFETASFELQNASYAELQKLRDLLLDNPEVHVQINGHTDNVGSDEDNKILSEKRAESVAAYLQSSGIPKERINAMGFGELKPIADNSFASGRKKNRRTEFVLIYP